MIPHIKMTDDSVTLQLSTGSRTITPKSFNYLKICKLLDSSSEADILPLLIVPPLPDGIYHLYLVDTILITEHITETSSETRSLTDESSWSSKAPRTFLGIYAAIDDIRDDYPEYFI